MEFSNNNPTDMTLAEIRREAYKQGYADALAKPGMHKCGGAWMYCNGVCHKCPNAEHKAANKTEMKGENG